MLCFDCCDRWPSWGSVSRSEKLEKISVALLLFLWHKKTKLSFYEADWKTDLMTSSSPFISSPSWSPPPHPHPSVCFTLFSVFSPLLPLQFFRAKNKISSARALGKAALGLALARTDALNLRGLFCLRGEEGRDGGTDGVMETKRLEARRMVGGLKPACISWGLGVKWAPSEEVSGPGLPGWLGNWPPCDSALSCALCQLTAWEDERPSICSPLLPTDN